MNKEIIRKKYIEIRKNIENKDVKSEIIFNKLISLDLYKEANVIALYNNLKSEVDTSKLIKYSLKIGKTVLLPRVVNNNLKFYKVTFNDELIKSSFGVFEPSENENNYVSSKKINLMIVPGVCFDKSKNRMGFGKGYYDRYLENTNINTIGICFDEQIVSKLPVNKNDIRMKMIVSDSKVIM